MPFGNIVVLGADVVAKSYAVGAATIEARVERKITQAGYLLEARVKGNASGRPGPRAPTGDYRRSITTQRGRYEGSFAVIVGTNAPQGRRLEFGFVGVDSIGRHYNQPPYPHWRPALATIEEPLVRDVYETTRLL